MTLSVVLLILGGLIGLAGYVWLVVAAFRIGAGWGLAILLLGWTWVPMILFAVRHWPAARRPLLLWAVGFALSAAGYLVIGAAVGAELLSGAATSTRTTDDADRPAPGPDPGPGILPPPRPTARPTHPSWEAVVSEMGREEAAADRLASSGTPVPDRSGADSSAPASLPWRGLERYVGRHLTAALVNGSEVTVQLVAVEPDRIRVRQVMGGGAAAYWIERDQVLSLRPVD